MADSRKQADVAVVVPTVLRPSLLRAVRSVFRQRGVERIQVLVGIDIALGDKALLRILAAECPPHVTLTVLDLGYSTSARHGGSYPNHYSGALRTILSYAADSPYVAYLDDDDWWGRDHLSSLLAVIPGKDWAFSLRWMADRDTGWPICRDEWDSLGPGRGINRERFGGFVSPSNLLLNQQACHFDLPFWALAPFPDGTGEDRLVFRALLKHTAWAGSGLHTCFYEIPREVQLHEHHAREFAARGLAWMGQPEQIRQIREGAEQAAQALQRHDFPAVGQACRQALALNPYHAGALRCLAQAQALRDKRKEAETVIADALAVDDADPDILAAWREITGEA